MNHENIRVLPDRESGVHSLCSVDMEVIWLNNEVEVCIKSGTGLLQYTIPIQAITFKKGGKQEENRILRAHLWLRIECEIL
jgi:hypothetical protein